MAISQRSTKKKICANGECRKSFLPTRIGQKVCSPGCAIAIARIKSAYDKEAKPKRKKKTEIVRDMKYWKEKADLYFNRFIVLRDREEPCISCGKHIHYPTIYQAGHYMAKSVRPLLRYDINNVHKQCSQCNKHQHGNLIAYRENLIKKIGIDEVERLESSDSNCQSQYRATAADYEHIAETYREKIKHMK